MAQATQRRSARAARPRYLDCVCPRRRRLLRDFRWTLARVDAVPRKTYVRGCVGPWKGRGPIPSFPPLARDGGPVTPSIEFRLFRRATRESRAKRFRIQPGVWPDALPNDRRLSSRRLFDHDGR